MDRIPLESSSAVSIGYDKGSRTMEIEYRPGGETYTYFDVPSTEVKAIAEADSIGAYVSQVFKKKYLHGRAQASSDPAELAHMLKNIERQRLGS